MEVSQQAGTGMNENKTEEEVEICMSRRYCFAKSRLLRTVKFRGEGKR
jgi:hypothetical protein